MEAQDLLSRLGIGRKYEKNFINIVFNTFY